MGDDPIKGADMALRALVVRLGLRVTTHPHMPLWLRIADVAEAAEAQVIRLRADLAALRVTADEAIVEHLVSRKEVERLKAEVAEAREERDYYERRADDLNQQLGGMK